MKMKKFSLVFLFVLSGIFLSLNVYAADNTYPYHFLGDQAQGDSGYVVAGDNSGSAGYSYKLEIPPGRNNFTPNLVLNYNSLNRNNDNIFGYGWDLSTGYIVRDPKEGVNNIYSKNYFKINIYGDAKELTAVNLSDGTHGTYGATVEEYWKYTFNTDNSWTIYDKKGTKYTFGLSAATRQDNPNDSTKIYKWMLEEVRDANDNYIKFEYYKDQGQIYPKKINYTGNGTTDGPITIAFEPFYTGPSSERTDKFNDYSAKFKVTTRYIIDKIKVFVSGEQSGNSVTEYDLNFTTGGNGIRLLLQTIQRYGRNVSGQLESLPETTFSYTTKANTWTNASSNWRMPETFVYNQSDLGVRVVDINGDGLPDVVRSGYDGQELKRVYLNTGNGWSSNNESWANTLPDKRLSGEDIRMADINGDNLSDIVVSTQNDDRRTYINTGSGWSLDANWYIPDRLVDYDHRNDVYSAGVRLVDVNGDGLVDWIRASMYHNDITNQEVTIKKVYLNNGSGWNTTIDSNYTNSLPVLFSTPPNTSSHDEELGNRMVDVNNDGLIDIISAFNASGNPKVYINTGSNWTQDANWATEGSFIFITGDHDFGFRIFDVNGDGLVDLVRSGQVYQDGYLVPIKRVYLNTGSSFSSSSSSYWADNLPYNFSEYGPINLYVEMQDVNGDGLDDFVYAPLSLNDRITKLADGYSADLLNSITESEGKTISYTYKPSTQYKDGSNNLENPSLPFIIHTLEQVIENDGLNHQYTTIYKYTGGDNYYSSSDIWNRRFTGFNLVQKTDPSGNITKEYYHQNGGVDGSSQGEYQDHFSKIGRSYRSEIYNSSSQKYYQTINKWDRTDLGNSRNFVNLAQAIEFSYDGQSSHKDKAKTFAYDFYGNISSEVNYGEVTGSDNGTFTDTGSDKIITNTSWTANTTQYIVGLPYQNTKLDNSNNQIWDQKIYYDNLSFGSIDKGNQTKEERWLTGSTYISTQKAYNSYGNITTDTNERNYSTSFGYDSNYFYPTSITNAKNQTSTVSYSTIHGKLLSQTDPNGFKTQYTYDPFGRLTKTEVPDFTTPATLRTQSENVYIDSGMPRKVQTKKYFDTTNYVDSYTYYDGFKRKVQAREQTETANQFRVTDFEYNGRSELTNEYLPYFATGSTYSSPNGSNPKNAYTYDALGRITQIQNSVGATTNEYLPWQVNTTDANSKVKKAYKDAFNRLIKVDEIDGANTYTTQYTYNQLGYLTKITDAAGNIRNFTNDTLGRRTQAEDLHGVSDQTFGVWNYGYDNRGNLTSKIDAKNQTTNYTYDELDRISTEDYTGQTGTEVAYTYDTAQNGIGYLANVVNADIITSYSYNYHNKIKSENRTINSVNYTTQFEYNLQDSQTKITYPDSAEISYEYNTGGQLERVLKKESGEANPASVIGNYDYASNNQPSKIDFANSTTTDNTYDSNKLYRLTNKTTYKNTGGQGGFDPLLDISNPNAISTYRVAELESERTVNSKSFLNSDNSITTEFHIGNIHYKDSNNDWQDIDLDMVDDGDNYKNKAHKFDSFVPPKAQQPRKIGIAGQFVSYRPINANNADAVLEQEGDKLTTAKYIDAWQSADLIYKNRWYGLKEEIVLKDNTAPTQFTFELHLTNINVEFKDNQIIYKDKNGNLLWQTQKPFAIDAYGQTRDVSMSLRQNGANYFVDLNLDAFKLVYPIIIDPTDTFYPDSDPEINSVDGEVYRYIAGGGTNNWSSIRNSTNSDSAGYATPSTESGRVIRFRSHNGDWDSLYRSIFLFNTASLPDDASISSAVFSIYGSGKTDGHAASPNVNIYSVNPASNSNIVKTDYNQTLFGGTEFSTAITYSNWSTAGYNDFSLNANGISGISKNGVTKFGVRNANYDVANAELPNKSQNSSYISSDLQCYFADQAGVSQDPRLVIVYNQTPPTAPTLLQVEGLSNPTEITDITPEFSSIYNDPDTGDYAKWYQIQVIEEGGNFSSPKWDSGKVELNPTLLQGQRSIQISYGGLPLVLDGKKYYWRMKYWDDEGITGAEGPWSDGIDYFVMKDSRNTYQNIVYTYDAVGNITQIVDSSGTNAARTVDYTYDNLHRLASATITNSPVGNYFQSYTYDSIGNITNKSDIGNYSYSQTSKTNPHAATTAGSTSYTYDDNGNLTGDGTYTYTWDYNNRLLSSTTGGTTYNYYYDHEGNRIKKVNGSNTTIYVNKYYEIAPDGKIKKYIFGGDDNIAIIETNGSTKTPYYVHKDHLGGSSIVTDSSGDKYELTDYYPYGTTRIDEKSGTFENTHKFTGKELDSETGLYYYGQRYYDPNIGRFISEDPVFIEVNSDIKDPQDLNSYAYARNNPIKNIDPDGRDWVSFGQGFTTGIATAAIAGLFIAAAPVIIPATAIATLAIGATALTGYGTYANYQAYTNGQISKDQFDYNAGGLLGGLALPGVLNTMGKTSEAVSTLQANKAAGAAFEKALGPQLQKIQSLVQPQITIKTSSGIKTRVDFMGIDSKGAYSLFEAKSSLSAPLTKNQSLAFPEIAKYGATVVGQGKTGFPGGTKIPPTSVKIIRP